MSQQESVRRELAFMWPQRHRTDWGRRHIRILIGWLKQFRVQPNCTTASCAVCRGKYREEIGRETIIEGRLMCGYCEAKLAIVSEEMRRPAACAR